MSAHSSPETELHRRVRLELVQRFAGSDLAYQVAIPTALLTAVANHLLAHWHDTTGPAASLFTVEFAARLGVAVAIMVPVMVWLMRRHARRVLAREQSEKSDRS